MPSIGELLNASSKNLEGTSIARIANEIQEKTSQYVGYNGRLLRGMHNLADTIAVMESAWNGLSDEMKDRDVVFIGKLHILSQIRYKFAMAMFNGARELAFDILIEYGFLGPLWRKENDGYTREQVLNIFCASFPCDLTVANLHISFPHWKYPNNDEVEEVFKPLKGKKP